MRSPRVLLIVALVASVVLAAIPAAAADYRNGGRLATLTGAIASSLGVTATTITRPEATTTAVTRPTPTTSVPSAVATRAASLTACAWPVESTPAKANVFYPDANATYWTTPFIAAKGVTITIAGTYPDARYFSVQVYNAAAQNYSAPVYGTSAISDYQLTPAATNPWVTAGVGTAGTYAVTVSDTAPAGTANLLPLPPAVRKPVGALDADMGFLMIRVYLPNGSNDDASVVPLPTVSFAGPRGGAVTLQPCTSAQTAPSQASQIKKAVVKAQVDKWLAGSGAPAPIPMCEHKQSGCMAPLAFFKAGLKTTPFPNASSSYVASLYTRAAGYVTVVKAAMPSSSTAAGDSPAPWSTVGPPQLRYWSICSYLHQAPFPVVSSAGSNGCAADEQLSTATTGGVAYVALSQRASRPPSLASVPSPATVAWLPVSTNGTQAAGLVAVRNMLPSQALPYDLKSTPQSDVAAAQTAMGVYYPEIAQCTTATFNAAAKQAGNGQAGALAGVRACFANPASPN